MAGAEGRVSRISSAVFVAGFVLFRTYFNPLCIALSRKSIPLLIEIVYAVLLLTKNRKSQP